MSNFCDPRKALCVHCGKLINKTGAKEKKACGTTGAGEA